MPERKALVVGINYVDTSAELHGAVNDALRWVEALGRFGLLEEAVGESDEKYSIPTRDNIVQGLDWLTSDASKGDCLTMIFCGRAMQVQGFAGASPFEEALCPLDWEGFWTHHVITDQELHEHFASLPGGVMLTLILDASFLCPPVRVPIKRSMEYPAHEQRNEVGSLRDDGGDENVWSRLEHVNALPRRLSHVGKRTFWTQLGRLLPEVQKPLDEGLAVFCITACGAGQCAIEAYLNGSQQGVLTFCLLEALKQFRQCTFLEWMTAANKEATRLRGEVLPALDQFFEIAYGRHVGLHESRPFDPACALLAKERAKRRRGEHWR
ncbi:pca1 [Symbiodinium natans]|uniref:Pca1 protein n=1 Tax=Symbiodinium natans TaxID=878477 RepID=A0A812JZG2_9DINO|nr:pca1 [Symbiodinium natans]